MLTVQHARTTGNRGIRSVRKRLKVARLRDARASSFGRRLIGTRVEEIRVSGTRPRIDRLSEAAITPDSNGLHFTIETDRRRGDDAGRVGNQKCWDVRIVYCWSRWLLPLAARHQGRRVGGDGRRKAASFSAIGKTDPLTEKGMQ
jgi:hypothetical protein